MKVTVSITKSFKIAVKPLLKKYSSLSKDLLALESELGRSPKSGIPLGNNVYKIRLKVSSKGKGKSGGARVISFIETTIVGEINLEGEETIVNLITIYDKSETASINEKELKGLIKAFYQNK